MPHRPPSAFRVLLVAFALAISGLVPAQVAGAAQTPSAEQLAIMDSIAESPLIEGRIAGLTVAVVQGADTIMMEAYGHADLEWDVPMTLDAVFEIGSVTKQFTAAAILMLRDEGKLDLEADISEYLPEFDTQGHRIPLWRLLDHTSGMRGATEIPEFRQIAQMTLPRDTLLDVIAAQPFDFEPGEALIYNNSAYILLGHIIERVSGMTYEDYIEQNIFEPLGMTRSSYCSNSDVVARRAHGYNLTRSGLAHGSFTNHLWPYSAGSLCSSVGDLITWLQALHGGRVLPDSSYHEMITPGRLNDGTPVRYAMGLSVAPDPRGRPAIHHGGGIGSGFVSHTAYYPGDDLMVAMLVNTTGNLSPALLSTELVDVLLPRPDLTLRSYEGDLTVLVGTYAGPARGRGLTVTVTATGTGPVVSANGGRGVPLSWIEGWHFRRGATQLITFERDGDDGPATVLRVDGGGSHYVLRRRD